MTGPPAPPHRLCRCGHIEDTHEHHRAGSDCGFCGRARCKAFRPAPRTRLMQALADWLAYRRARTRR